MCVYIRMCVCVCVSHVCVFTCVCVCACVRARVYACAYACACACACACMRLMPSRSEAHRRTCLKASSTTKRFLPMCFSTTKQNASYLICSSTTKRFLPICFATYLYALSHTSTRVKPSYLYISSLTRTALSHTKLAAAWVSCVSAAVGVWGGGRRVRLVLGSLIFRAPCSSGIFFINICICCFNSKSLLFQ
jgi:hypothetical protein